MTNQPAASNDDDGKKSTPTFAEQVAPLLTDLLYPSESDEPVEVVETYLHESLTAGHIRDWLMLPPAEPVEDMPEADFWAPVTTIEDWFGEEEKATANRFQELKDLIEKLLTDRQVFRVSRTEIDVYLLGKPTEGPRVGLKTRVVET